jgi:hypothetical protein
MVALQDIAAILRRIDEKGIFMDEIWHLLKGQHKINKKSRSVLLTNNIDVCSSILEISETKILSHAVPTPTRSGPRHVY